jgi:hypothetical protein
MKLSQFHLSTLLFVASLFVTPTTSQAFISDHHTFTATQSRDLGLNANNRWDAEASSDFITYQHPIAWENKWLRSQKTFDLSVGSISSKQFLNYQRLKINQAFTDKLEFRFLYLVEGDFEQDRRQMPLELKYNLNSKIAVSLFGSPALNKSEDDLGLSLYFTPTEEWEYRASLVWADYDRNKRNLNTEEWSEAPMGATLSVQYLSKETTDDFFKAEAHWERPSQKNNLGQVTEDLAYESLTITGWRTLTNGRGLGGRALYDRSFASNSTANRSRKRSLNQIEYAFIMGPHVVRPGLNFFYRENRSGTDQVITKEILPTVWMQFLPKGRSWGVGTPSLGYDATVFQEKHQASSDRNLEHRLNLKYDMRFNKSGELALLFTFDLDRFGSGETWEGGAGQFRLDF